MTLIEKVTEFARKAHFGIFRKDGKTPYIEHPIAVSVIVSNLLNGEYYWIASITDREHLRKLVTILALIHDIPEDVAEYLNDEDKVILVIRLLDSDKELSEMDYSYLLTCLRNLNKNNFKNYCEFVVNAKKIVGSRLVKLADIKHNISDLGDGSLKDKYRMSMFILES